ncbi:MAG: MBL fold metallo-hydrolase, partial [Gallionellaceae bacterium]|nr:MBL fold metallo-hydrolase [Gallionellaceae bacterium]
VAVNFDSDSKAAIASRIREFDAIAKSGATAAGAHLSFPGMGHIAKRGSGYEWMPLNYQSQP